MHIDDNPYTSPEATGQREELPDGDVDFDVSTQLDATRMWLMLLAIVLFVIGGFIGINVLFLLVIAGARMHVAIITFASIAGVFTFLFVVAGMMLLNARLLIGRFLTSGQTSWLERAMRAQNGFWMLSGLTGAILSGLYLIGFIWQLFSVGS